MIHFHPRSLVVWLTFRALLYFRKKRLTCEIMRMKFNAYSRWSYWCSLSNYSVQLDDVAVFESSNDGCFLEKFQTVVWGGVVFERFDGRWNSTNCSMLHSEEKHCEALIVSTTQSVAHCVDRFHVMGGKGVFYSSSKSTRSPAVMIMISQQDPALKQGFLLSTNAHQQLTLCILPCIWLVAIPERGPFMYLDIIMLVLAFRCAQWEKVLLFSNTIFWKGYDDRNRKT